MEYVMSEGEWEHCKVDPGYLDRVVDGRFGRATTHGNGLRVYAPDGELLASVSRVVVKTKRG